MRRVWRCRRRIIRLTVVSETPSSWATSGMRSVNRPSKREVGHVLLLEVVYCFTFFDSIFDLIEV